MSLKSLFFGKALCLSFNIYLVSDMKLEPTRMSYSRFCGVATLNLKFDWNSKIILMNRMTNFLDPITILKQVIVRTMLQECKQWWVIKLDVFIRRVIDRAETRRKRRFERKQVPIRTSRPVNAIISMQENDSYCRVSAWSWRKKQKAVAFF